MVGEEATVELKNGIDGTTREVEEGLRFAGRKTRVNDDEDEDDMDALIEELESLDPDAAIEDRLNEMKIGGAVPEELLQTDTRVGLTDPEVIQRRRKYGLNQLREDKENLLKKFAMYFVGPISIRDGSCCNSCNRSTGLRRLWCYLCAPPPQRVRRLHTRISGSLRRGGTQENSRLKSDRTPRREIGRD